MKSRDGDAVRGCFGFEVTMPFQTSAIPRVARLAVQLFIHGLIYCQAKMNISSGMMAAGKKDSTKML
jgi:hypothetical protein